jgi:hypothetical protein
MKFDTASLQKHRTGHFGFSAVKLDDLGSAQYTLVTIVADRSGSTAGYQTRMENVLKEVLKACARSDFKDSLMLRLVTFEESHHEEHGFMLLSQCDPASYDGVLPAGGMTALYDATVDAVEATANYGNTLTSNDYTCNGIVIVITDGMNNRGKMTANQVKNAFEQCVKSENLESLLSILVGVCDKQMPDYTTVSQYLQEFQNTAGFTQYVELADANEKTLAKLAAFISKSISSTSQALGSGGPSQTVAF